MKRTLIVTAAVAISTLILIMDSQMTASNITPTPIALLGVLIVTICSLGRVKRHG